MTQPVARIPCACQQCGKIFEVLPGRIKNGGGKYCSQKCSGLSAQRLNREKAKVRPQPQSKPIRECAVCGRTFVSKYVSTQPNHGKYCSKACRGISCRGEKSPFWKGGFKRADRGPNWSIQRKAAYQRDGSVCQNCGYKTKRGQRKNEVHHIIPYRKFNGDYFAANDLLNLITLCRKCHQKAEHGKIAVPKRLL